MKLRILTRGTFPLLPLENKKASLIFKTPAWITINLTQEQGQKKDDSWCILLIKLLDLNDLVSKIIQFLRMLCHRELKSY